MEQWLQILYEYRKEMWCMSALKYNKNSRTTAPLWNCCGALKKKNVKNTHFRFVLFEVPEGDFLFVPSIQFKVVFSFIKNIFITSLSIDCTLGEKIVLLETPSCCELRHMTLTFTLYLFSKMETFFHLCQFSYKKRRVLAIDQNNMYIKKINEVFLFFCTWK